MMPKRINVIHCPIGLWFVPPFAFGIDRAKSVSVVRRESSN